MVIHEENEAPVEIAIIKKPAVLETKKYVIVKNHVRELTVNGETDSEHLPEKNTSTTSENKKKKKQEKKKPKCTKKLQKRSHPPASSTESDEPSGKISKNDLEELKTVYNKCKAIVQKIETKYGHLLDLDNETDRTLDQRTIKNKKNDDDNVCNCTVNKKIIFDDNGAQSVSVTSLEKHVCPQKLAHKLVHNSDVKKVQIVCDNVDASLPDDLNELVSILRDPTIETIHRNNVIAKIKNMKRDALDEIKFNKPTLIEQLKKNPEEILEFSGTNLCELPGYVLNQD